MVRFFLLALALAAPAADSRQAGEAKLAGMLQGRTAGQPQSCLPLLRGDDNSQTIERIGTVYDVGSTRYVMRFQGGCDQLTRFAYAVARTPTTQFCQGDIAQIFLRGAPPTPVGSCIYGNFTPYTRTR